MKKKYSEIKELMLLEIEGTAHWRATLAHRFPDSKEINLKASKALNKLHEYVEKLPEHFTIFNWCENAVKESEISWFNDELRRYGYQNQSETPEQFISRITQEGVTNGLIDQAMDQEN